MELIAPQIDLLHHSLEIDVKPRKKEFSSKKEKQKFIAAFRMKTKTEICKNWELKGFCRYSEKCAFAHGKSELKEKTHLNANFKTKPCKQYFLQGYCSYGYRCQYLHSELKKRPEHQSFLLEIYFKKGISLSFLQIPCEAEAIALGFIEERIRLMNFDELGIEEIYRIIPHKKRLAIFRTFA